MFDEATGIRDSASRGAIVMCKEAKISDPQLCVEIRSPQSEQIERMKAMLAGQHAQDRAARE